MERLVQLKDTNQYEACRLCKYTKNCALRPGGELGDICLASDGQNYPKGGVKIKSYNYYY